MCEAAWLCKSDCLLSLQLASQQQPICLLNHIARQGNCKQSLGTEFVSLERKKKGGTPPHIDYSGTSHFPPFEKPNFSSA